MESGFEFFSSSPAIRGRIDPCACYPQNEGKEATVAAPFSFNKDVLADAIRRIYKKEIDPDREIDEGMFEETLRIINQATDEGISAASIDVEKAFTEAIKNKNEVFSAFRVHSLQTQMAGELLNEDGKLRTFSEFKEATSPIASHSVDQYLRTEYDTAVLRARQAANWQQFEAEKDVLPNLRWVPSTSSNPGADHKIWWGTVLPVDHPFWTAHKPGDRWNCKCDLEATDDKCTKVPEGYQSKMDLPNNGLENNPAQDGKLFSEKHPYFPVSCSMCPFSVNVFKDRLMSVFRNKKKDCVECEFAKGCVEKLKIRKNYHYDKKWSIPYVSEKGYIAVEEGHGASELEQNKRSAKPLADDGMRVELIRQKTIRIDSFKKKITTRDANVFGSPNVESSKWEFKFTENYECLSNSMGTKAAQAVAQGADVVLIDIKRTKLFSDKEVIDGVFNSFNYNPELKGIVVMIESREYRVISRKYYTTGRHEEMIKNWLVSIN